jgi:ER lumen protein retaining receptor
MRWKYPKSYNKSEDTFPNPRLYLIIPCAILAVIWPQKWTPFEVLWTFSIYLESVAVLPQLFMLHKSGETVEALTTHYIACLGGYRAMYIFNWVYRVISEPHYRQWIVWVAGLVQTIIYLDFFYYYARSLIEKRKMALPTNFAA